MCSPRLMTDVSQINALFQLLGRLSEQNQAMSDQPENSLLKQLEKMNRRARLHLYPHISNLCSTSVNSQMRNPSSAMVDYLKLQFEHSPNAILDELNQIFVSLGQCRFTVKLFSRLYDLLVDNLLDSNASQSTRIDCATTLTLATLVTNEKVFHLCTHLFWLSFGEFYEEGLAQIVIKSHLLQMMAITLTLFDQDQFKLFVRSKMAHLVDCLGTSKGQVQLAVSTCLAIVFRKFRGFQLLPPISANLDQIKYIQLKIEIARIMQNLSTSNKAFKSTWRLVEERDYVEKVVPVKGQNEVVKIDSIEKRIFFDLFSSVLANDLQPALKSNHFVRQFMKPQVRS